MTMRKERVLTGLSGAGTTTRLGFVCVLSGSRLAEGGHVLDVTVIRAAAAAVAAHVFPLGTQKHTVASAALSPSVSFSPPADSVYARGAPCVFIFVIGVTREPPHASVMCVPGPRSHQYKSVCGPVFSAARPPIGEFTSPAPGRVDSNHDCVAVLRVYSL